MNGKGSKPRNCFSSQFKDNYDLIDWCRVVKQKESPKEPNPETYESAEDKLKYIMNHCEC